MEKCAPDTPCARTGDCRTSLLALGGAALGLAREPYSCIRGVGSTPSSSAALQNALAFGKKGAMGEAEGGGGSRER